MTEEILRLMMMNTIGLSILSETIRTASKFPIHHSSSSIKSEAAQCYYFVQGTGLDALIIDYDLDYDPEQIRSSFNYYLIHRKAHNGKS